MSKRPRLPFLPRLLLRWLLPQRDREFIIGDLDEEYLRERLRGGVVRARVWYWRQALASLVSETRYGVGAAPAAPHGAPARGSWFDAGRQDVRHALRALNRRPVFTVVALLTLALGIGANTGIFSIVNWLLLRPVPGVERPEELAIIEISDEPGQNRSISWPNYSDILSAQRSFVALAGYGSSSLVLQTENTYPEMITAQAVGGDYFGTLEIGLQLGRPIRADETVAGRPARVVVISDALWTRLFQRDRNVIGKTLRANKVELTVIGVTPPGFEGVERNGGIQAWVPQSIYPELRHASAEFAERLNGRRGGAMRELVGRLRPGVSAQAARADLTRIVSALHAAYPAENAIFENRSVFVHPGIGVPVILRPRTTATVRLMLILVSMLLIISSANVGNMLLVRGLQARPAAALRRALGASTWRLAGQQMAECLLLALGGGLLGLLVARDFLAFVEGGQLLGLPVFQNIPIDWRVLAFTAAVCIGSGLLFALAPLRIVRQADPLVELKSSGGRHTRDKHRLRSGIAVVQIALSLTLLAGALLLTRTVLALQRVDLGFDPERVAGIYLNAEPQGYQPAAMPALRRALLDALRAQPEIESAALAYRIPFASGGFGSGLKDPLGRSVEEIAIDIQFASDGYLETLGIPILRGRAFQPRDWISPTGPVAVVLSQAAARRLFGDREAVGQRLDEARGNRQQLLVVGVAQDSRLGRLHEAPPVLVYMPIGSFNTTQLSVVMRSRGQAATLELAARRALTAVDPALSMRFQLVGDNVRNSIAEQRVLSRMLALFSLLAVALAGIGLYGILSFMVGERTREFGIRIALGARLHRIGAQVARQAALLVLIGLVLGIVGAHWLGSLMISTLTGVAPLEITVYMLAALFFLLIALIATAIPTLAAARVHPSVALRQD